MYPQTASKFVFQPTYHQFISDVFCVAEHKCVTHG